MTILEVVRRTTEEDRFYVDVDLDNVNVGKFLGMNIEDPVQLNQLKNLLVKANCEGKVTRSIKASSWYFNPTENVSKSEVAGKLEVRTTHYVKVKFNVTCVFDSLFEVRAKNARDAMSTLIENLDSELEEFVREVQPSLCKELELSNLDYEVLACRTDRTDIPHCPETVTKVYVQED